MKRVLFFAAALAAAPLGAQGASETELKAQLETASVIAKAIEEGADLKLVEGLFGLSSPEYAELARLEGCDPFAKSSAHPEHVVIEWSCGPQTTTPGLARVTQMLFDDGVLEGFSINPVTSQFAAFEDALPQPSAKAKKSLGKRFGQLASGRNGAQLRSLVPLNEDQLARFEYVGGSEYRVASASGDRVEVKFRAFGGQELNAFVHFDADDRPIGLTFAPTVCSNCSEWVQSERQRRSDDRRTRDRRFFNSESNRQNLERPTDQQIRRSIQKACPDCP